MTQHVAVTREGPVQVLRIARPEKKNALTADMYAALCKAIEAGDADNDVAVHVIVGSAGVFTAGNDIADFLAGGTKEVLRFIRLLPVVKKPMIAAVDGLAVGIGTTMLFHCDLVYATPTAKFATPFLDLGIVPEAGSSLLMPRAMGDHRAFEMLVLGDAFDAEKARESGFVNAIVPAAELEATAMKSAMRLATKPQGALALARRLLRGDRDEILQRVNEEAITLEKCLSSPEAREAFQAFLEKRPPRFSPQSG